MPTPSEVNPPLPVGRCPPPKSGDAARVDQWHPAGQPEPVKIHDFVDPALGKANPYGVYDVANDTGWVSGGTDHDTAAFAVNTITTWWQQVGKPLHPNASRLLICADGGAERVRPFVVVLVCAPTNPRSSNAMSCRALPRGLHAGRLPGRDGRLGPGGVDLGSQRCGGRHCGSAGRSWGRMADLTRVIPELALSVGCCS